jgi:hypothetical protein
MHFPQKTGNPLCIAGILSEITIKAPSNPGKFPLYYRLTCEGFPSGYRELEVIVD